MEAVLAILCLYCDLTRRVELANIVKCATREAYVGEDLRCKGCCVFWRELC